MKVPARFVVGLLFLGMGGMGAAIEMGSRWGGVSVIAMEIRLARVLGVLGELLLCLIVLQHYWVAWRNERQMQAAVQP